MTDKLEPKYKVQRMDGTWSKEYSLSEPYSDAVDVQAIIITEYLTRKELNVLLLKKLIYK